MNLKKIAPLAISALLLGGGVVVAHDALSIKESVELEEQSMFIQVAGTIDSSEVRGEATYYFLNEKDNPFYLVISNDTLMFNNTGKEVTISAGDRVTAYMYADQPMLTIYPPQYNPTVVIVDSESIGTASVGTFNENLLDSALSLKLNVSNETTIVNNKSEKLVVADFKGGNAVVFYTITTRSIPAQTSPTKIVVLDSEEEVSAENSIDAIIGEDRYVVDGTTMVPLRKVAEQLGYHVKATSNGALLSKGAHSYTLTRGEKMFGYNKALGQFTEAPALLEQGKTYVEYDFALQLLD